ARLMRDARHQGGAERFEAHAADALVALCTNGGPGSKARTDLVVVADLYAWRRGHAHQKEPCQLIGGGPIPVDLAKELAKDAFLKVVLHDGTDVQKVLHVGRRVTAALKTALDLGPAPMFTGRACVDCGRRYGLEYDHTDPIAHDGPTSMRNVVARCYPCHKEKTERDRVAGLLGNKTRRDVFAKRSDRPPPRKPGPRGEARDAGPKRDARRPGNRGREGVGVPDTASAPASADSAAHGPP
ncbi:MAG TPA: HNH endonuclease signature motif containing protein, partial [Acidimicrobiales bacterium]|nr:HNH endonuclease signature motif containing protein [Acidimicrobiales bacterium]